MQISEPQRSPKTGHSRARNIDTEASPYRLPRHEQCFERRKETASYRTGKARMAFTTDRASHGCPPGNRERLPESSRSGGVPAGVGAPSAFKTGHTGDHRLLCGFFAKFGATQRSEVCRPARANPIASRSSWDSALAGMPWQFGKTWCRTTVLLAAMRR